MGLFFKIFGLRYPDPSGPPTPRDGDYLSNLQFAQYGDILVDEDGSPIQFGSVGIQYGTPPAPESMEPGETRLWYELTTATVWSRTKETDGVTIVDADMGQTATDMMLKSVYDSNDDGIVNGADMLYGGPYVVVTASEARTHLDNADIHRQINDTIEDPEWLWSSQRIQQGLNTVAIDAAQIVSGVIDWDRLPIAVDSQEDGDILVWNSMEGQFVNAGITGEGISWGYDPYNPQEFVLSATITLDGARVNGDTFYGDVHFDYGTISGLPMPTVADEAANKEYVDNLRLEDLYDTDIQYAADANMLMYDGSDWNNIVLMSAGMASLSMDWGERKLTISVPYEVVDEIGEYPSPDNLVSELGLAPLQDTLDSLGVLAFLDTVDTVHIEDNAVTTDKLTDTGVMAGSYINADVTVDSKGRVTSITDGSTSDIWTMSPDGYSIYYDMGGVAIGADVPLGMLHVQGDTYIADILGLGDTTNRLYAINGELFWDGTQLGVDLGPWELGGSAGIYYNAGSVGVGTTTPTEALHVVGNLRVEGQMFSPPVDLVDAATTVADGDDSNLFRWTIGGNRTLNLTNIQAGSSYAWRITQDGSGNRVITYGTMFQFPNGEDTVLSTDPGAVDLLTGISFDGVSVICALRKDIS